MISPSIEKMIASDRFPTYNSRLSLNYGLKSNLYLTPQIKLNTGLILLDKGSVAPVTIETDLFHHALYLSVPISVQYNLSITKRTSVGPSVGLIYGRRVYEYFKQITRDRVSYALETWNVNDNYFGGTLGLEINSTITDRFSLSITPRYNRQLNDLRKSTTIIQERFDSFLLEITCWYNLKTKRSLTSSKHHGW